MQKTEMSVVEKLDNGLSKGLCRILDGLKITALWLVGLWELASLPLRIFEYKEGLSDLSPTELIFLPLMGLLLWRQIHYSRRFGAGFWSGFSRLLIALGMLSMLFHIAWAASWSLYVSAPSENIANLSSLMFFGTPLESIAYLTLTLFAIYLAAPHHKEVPLAMEKIEPQLGNYETTTTPSTGTRERTL